MYVCMYVGVYVCMYVYVLLLSLRIMFIIILLIKHKLKKLDFLDIEHIYYINDIQFQHVSLIFSIIRK